MKALKKLLTAAAALALLGACASSSDTTKVSGNTYTFTSCTVDGEDATDTINALYESWSFTFNKDDTCIQTMVWSGDLADLLGNDPIEQEGTYAEAGSQVTVTFASDEGNLVMTFEISDEAITFSEDGSVSIFTKE